MRIAGLMADKINIYMVYAHDLGISKAIRWPILCSIFHGMVKLTNHKSACW